jgi:hypothetical protein
MSVSLRARFFFFLCGSIVYLFNLYTWLFFFFINIICFQRTFSILSSILTNSQNGEFTHAGVRYTINDSISSSFSSSSFSTAHRIVASNPLHYEYGVTRWYGPYGVYIGGPYSLISPSLLTQTNSTYNVLALCSTCLHNPLYDKYTQGIIPSHASPFALTLLPSFMPSCSLPKNVCVGVPDVIITTPVKLYADGPFVEKIKKKMGLFMEIGREKENDGQTEGLNVEEGKREGSGGVNDNIDGDQKLANTKGKDKKEVTAQELLESHNQIQLERERLINTYKPAQHAGQERSSHKSNELQYHCLMAEALLYDPTSIGGGYRECSTSTDSKFDSFYKSPTTKIKTTLPMSLITSPLPVSQIPLQNVHSHNTGSLISPLTTLVPTPMVQASAFPGFLQSSIEWKPSVKNFEVFFSKLSQADRKIVLQEMLSLDTSKCTGVCSYTVYITIKIITFILIIIFFFSFLLVLDEAHVTRYNSSPLELLHVDIQFLVDFIALQNLKRVFLCKVMGLADIVCKDVNIYCVYCILLYVIIVIVFFRSVNK